MSVENLIGELKRRRVFRALIGYGLAAFAVLQIIEPIMHGLHWSDEVLSFVVAGLAVGFPVVVSLAWIFDVNAGRVERAAPAEGSLRGVGLALVLVGIGALAAAPGVVWYFFLRAPRPPAATRDAALRASLDQAPPASDIRARPSIGVLPFVDMSPGKDQEYFTDGLAEELLNLLAKVPGLSVAARTSAFSFKGKGATVGAIASALNVDTVLEGSVRKAGDRVRITAQLINARDGYHVWSETYDRRLTDVFAVQDEIAQAVVSALQLKLLPAQVPTTKDRRTANPVAYSEYLLGKQLLIRSTRETSLAALTAFEKAVHADPDFAPGWAGLATARFWVADSAESTAAVSDGQRAALEAAERAVALAPGLGEALGVRGWLRGPLRWEWEGCRADFERALALEPANAELWTHYANYLLATGRMPEAIAATRKGAQLDPLNGQAWDQLGWLLVVSGFREEGKAALLRSLELNPVQAYASAWLALLAILEGKPADALEPASRSTMPVFRLMYTSIALRELGREREARAALDEIVAKNSHDGAFQIAELYAHRGEADRAFAWLERARAQHDGGLTEIRASPFLRGIFKDRRYAAFLRSINLPTD